MATDLPGVSEGRFWSDAATYRAMAESLAFDRDLRFGPEDLERVREVYPGGPQGLFAKRVPDGEGGTMLVYAKALVYPLFGAPFVGVLLKNTLGDNARPIFAISGVVVIITAILMLRESRLEKPKPSEGLPMPTPRQTAS